MSEKSDNSFAATTSGLGIYSIVSRSSQKQIECYKKKGPKVEDGKAIEDFIKLNEKYLKSLKEVEDLKVVDDEKLSLLKVEFSKNIIDFKALKSTIYN